VNDLTWRKKVFIVFLKNNKKEKQHLFVAEKFVF